MSFAHKTRVAVLRGGPSSEYEVSLKTGEAVLKSLPQKYEGVDVFIDREGVWHVHGIARTPADALKHVDPEGGRQKAMTQFLDEKSFKPGLGDLKL